MLARVRWGNVALAATIVGVAVLVAAWPALRAPAPPAPDPAPRPMATTLPTRPTVTTPPPPEFEVRHTAPIAKPRPVTPERRPAARHRPAPKPHRHRHRRPAPPVASPAPPQPAPAPQPVPVPRRQHVPSSVTAEFGPPPEF